MSESKDAIGLAQVLVEEMQALEVLGPEFRLKAADPDAALREITAGILGKERKLTALCFSGGGIRSATFCLGALQQLAKLKLLSRFDYLSTVSGGGFIGSWLKAWTLRDDGKGGKLGIAGVEDLIGKARVEPKPVQLLRYYSNYLAPRFGLLSADTWTIAATWLRNVLLNWLVLIPLLMLPLLAPMLYLSLLNLVRDSGPALSHWWLFSVAIAAAAYGTFWIRQGLPSSGAKQLTQGRFLWHCLLPAAVSVSLFALWWQRIIANVDDVMGITFWSYCPWLSGMMASEHLFDFSSLIGIALAFYLSAFLIGKAYAAFRAPSVAGSVSVPASGRWRWVKELGAMLATALVATILVWSWTRVFWSVDDWFTYVCFGLPALLAVFTLCEVFYIGVASYLTDEMDREFWARAGAWDLILMVAWIGISVLALYGPVLIESIGPAAKAALFGTGAAAGGFAARLGHSALTSALAENREKQTLMDKLLDRLALPAALLVFSVVLMAFLAWVATWLLQGIGEWVGASGRLLAWAKSAGLISSAEELAPLAGAATRSTILGATPFWIVVAAAVLLWAVQALMARVIHINKFSLHAAYGNRIMRAYLGASRGSERKPNRFTGFDPADNTFLSVFQNEEVKKPLHVINIALNLVHGRNLAWQERKASSFTASAWHCGGYDVGYRPTGEYGGDKGMTLGNAVTMSGAAFTPNAGYHSSPLLTFVMAFFNVRLGWWLGNPRYAAASKKPGPRHAAAPLISETFGLTTDENQWVYLSDGGHFDNLGLYEMVVRRVREIVVIDSGADPKYEFEDLGNAIRKIRADLGISIELERGGSMKIARRQPGGAYSAVFRIRYSDVHDRGQPQEDFDGRLLYIKPALNGSEPRDVTQHSTTSEDFPHDTTADQFFTESQFESYRVLGMHELGTIAADMDAGTASVAALIEHGRDHSDAAKP